MLEYDTYAPWYDAQNRLDDVEFYLEAATRWGTPILEAGCGTGRLLIPLAREGFLVTGLDTSSEMLRLCRAKIAREAPEVQQRISVSFADVRQFQLLPLYKTVIFGCNTFQHLLTNTDQNQALQSVHRHMETDARLFLQSTNVRFDEHQSDTLYYRGREFQPESGETIDIFYSFQLDTQLQIQKLHLLLDIIGEEGLVTRRKVTLTFRYFFPPELERLLDNNGFELEGIYGDFQKNPLRPDSTWIIAQARKKP